MRLGGVKRDRPGAVLEALVRVLPGVLGVAQCTLVEPAPKHLLRVLGLYLGLGTKPKPRHVQHRASFTHDIGVMYSRVTPSAKNP